MEAVSNFPNHFLQMANFYMATQFDRVESIIDQLQQGVDVDAQDSLGNTAAHLACFDEGNPDRLKILLSYKPNLNIQNKMLSTPLNIYMCNIHLDDSILKTFLELGADPNIADILGNTPLHYLSEHRSQNYVDSKGLTYTFLKYRANVNIQNKNGDTPLHWAVENMAFGFIKAFIKTEASVFIKNQSNYTAFDLAYRSRDVSSRVFIEIAKLAIISNIFESTLNQDITEEMYRYESLRTFKEKCDTELSKLRNIKVANTNVTLYVILKSSTNDFAKYLRNDEILTWFRNFNSEDCEIYGTRIIRHFERSLERKEVEDCGYLFCETLFPSLPDHCITDIIFYFKNEDIDKLKYISSIEFQTID